MPPRISREEALRLSAMASHSQAELREAARTLAEAACDCGLEPSRLGLRPRRREDEVDSDESLARAA